MKKIIIQAVNRQIKEELNSAYIYLGMAAYADSQNLSGFANWFRVQFKEEIDHAFGLYNHLAARGAKITFSLLPEPKVNYSNITEAVQITLKHERYITGQINELYSLAGQQKDYALRSFLGWYIDEQLEEESSAQGLLDKLSLIGSKGAALYLLDGELAARKYSPASILSK